jgi:hypothetical protein
MMVAAVMAVTALDTPLSACLNVPLGLLQRLQGLLRAREIAALQILANLVESLRQRTIGARTLPLALQIGQARVSLLGVAQIARLDRLGELIESLAKLVLLARLRLVRRRRCSDCRDGHGFLPTRSGGSFSGARPGNMGFPITTRAAPKSPRLSLGESGKHLAKICGGIGAIALQSLH